MNMESINTLKSIISPSGETYVLAITDVEYYEGDCTLRVKVMNSPSRLEPSSQGFSDVVVTFNAVAHLDDEALRIEPDSDQSTLEVDGYNVSESCKENAAYEIDQNWVPFGGDGEIYNYIQNDDALVSVHDQIIKTINELKLQVTTH